MSPIPPDPDVGTDLVELSYVDLVRRVPDHGRLPLPARAATTLPMGDLDPELFERLVAEVVQRRDNRGVQFYGRRGQAQHGLDIVAREPSLDRRLYQVRRYQELTPARLRDAVVDYAGPPSSQGQQMPARQFEPSGFVLATSASLDDDTLDDDTRVTDLSRRRRQTDAHEFNRTWAGCLTTGGVTCGNVLPAHPIADEYNR